MNAETINNWPSTVRVSIRQTWADGWTITPYLHCDALTQAASPSISQAQFTWHVGSIKQQDAPTFEDFDVLDLQGWFVLVELATGDAANPTYKPLFCGVIDFDRRDFRGDQASVYGNADQRITAYGLEVLLDRAMISSAWITNGGADTSGVEIDHVPAFNESFATGGTSPIGNRSEDMVKFFMGSDEVQSYAFGEGTRQWTMRDILQYLLSRYMPANVRFNAGGQYETLGTIIPTRLEVGGVSVLQALNQIIDHRRGYGWHVRIQSSEGTEEWTGDPPATLYPYFYVYGIIEAELSVGSETVPANAEQIDEWSIAGLEFDQVTQIKSGSVAYGTIRVMGERVRSMFSLSVADGTLRKGWSDTLEDSYRSASDATRAIDSYRVAFSHFNVAANWDWKTKDGIGGGAANPANFKIDSDGDYQPYGTNEAIKVRTWGNARRFEDRLPIKKPSLDGIEAEWLEPMAFVEYESGKWAHVEKLHELNLPSGHLRMLDNQMGVEVRFDPSHILALNHWTGAAESAKGPQFDYEDLIVTVCAETDERLKVIQTIEGNDATKVLEIEVPNAHFWWVAPQTILRLNNEALVRHDPSEGLTATYPSGCIARNDAPRLRRIAALARAWYGRTRNAVSVTLRGLPQTTVPDPEDENAEPITVLIHPGHLIKTLADAVATYTVNTIVSEVAWDFIAGSVTVTTSYAELDFVTR